MSKAGDDIIRGLRNAVAYLQGKPVRVRVHTVWVADPRAIRRKLRMSQREFASAYRIPLATLKNWEQGRRAPDAPAAAYLTAISRRPREIRKALAN